jgi:hypothetical protein
MIANFIFQLMPVHADGTANRGYRSLDPASLAAGTSVLTIDEGKRRYVRHSGKNRRRSLKVLVAVRD